MSVVPCGVSDESIDSTRTPSVGRQALFISDATNAHAGRATFTPTTNRAPRPRRRLKNRRSLLGSSRPPNLHPPTLFTGAQSVHTPAYTAISVGWRNAPEPVRSPPSHRWSFQGGDRTGSGAFRHPTDIAV